MIPTVSAIIPVYNRLPLLESVVESILAQTLPVLEVILIDDGSKEHQAEDVERLIAGKSTWRERVRYRYQENQGQSVANNVGIEMARGEWLAFDGSDDLWLPEKLEWQFRALREFKNKSAACFTDANFVHNSEKKGTLFRENGMSFSQTLGLVEDSVQLALSGHAIQVQTLVARTDLVRKLGGLDPNLRWGEDLEFVFRLALATKYCFVNLPLTAISRAKGRHTGAGEMWHGIEYCLEQELYRYEKLLSLSEGLSRGARRLIVTNLASVLSVLATVYLRKREYERARQAVSRAAGYKLTFGRAVKWCLTWAAPALAEKVVSAPDWTWGH